MFIHKKKVKGLKTAEILGERGGRREVNWMREVKELREREGEKRWKGMVERMNIRNMYEVKAILYTKSTF